MSHQNLYDNAKPSRAKNHGIKRNNFDVSHRHHASYGLGKLYPMYTRMLNANESLSVKPIMDFEIDPIAHTLNNSIRANVAFYKVPLRILWKDFPAFFHCSPTAKTTPYIPPYLQRTDNIVYPGSLLNHMGVPAVAHSSAPAFISVPLWKNENDKVNYGDGYVDFNQIYPHAYNHGDNLIDGTEGGLNVAMPAQYDYRLFDLNTLNHGTPANAYSLLSIADNRVKPNAGSAAETNVKPIWFSTTPLPYDIEKVANGQYNFRFYRLHTANTTTSVSFRLMFFCGENWANSVPFAQCDFSTANDVNFPVVFTRGSEELGVTRKLGQVRIPDNICDDIAHMRKQGKVFVCGMRSGTYSNLQKYRDMLRVCPTTTIANVKFLGKESELAVCPGVYDHYEILAKTDTSTVDTSRFNGQTEGYRLTALFARAYDAVYNAVFRNKVYDPFCPAVNPHDSSTDTTPYLDRCVCNLDGGADTDTPLDFARVEWSADHYNGCTPTPSFITDKPLVGIVDMGENITMNYEGQKSGSAPETGTIKLSVAEDGGVRYVKGIQSYEGFDSGSLTLETLKDAIKIGIPVDAFRTANALFDYIQKDWKQGRFSWRQFVGAHFGTFPDGVAENFPQQIGHMFSKQLSDWDVVANNPTEFGPIGMKGAMGQFKSGCPTYKVFTKEPCIVLGLVWFTCDNCMVDPLNRYWFLSRRDDFGSPEFANLQPQAVYQREVAPLLADPAKPYEIFGWNRPFGHMVEFHDTLAGDYCLSRQGEILVRKLKGKPVVGLDFRTMDTDELTSIWQTKSGADHIFGHFYFKSTQRTWLPQRPNLGNV